MSFTVTCNRCGLDAAYAQVDAEDLEVALICGGCGNIATLQHVPFSLRVRPKKPAGVRKLPPPESKLSWEEEED